MVARRAHNPEVVRFKSHLRNQKESNSQGLLFFAFENEFCASRPPEEGVGFAPERRRWREKRGAEREEDRSIGTRRENASEATDLTSGPFNSHPATK